MEIYQFDLPEHGTNRLFNAVGVGVDEADALHNAMMGRQVSTSGGRSFTITDKGQVIVNTLPDGWIGNHKWTVVVRHPEGATGSYSLRPGIKLDTKRTFGGAQEGAGRPELPDDEKKPRVVAFPSPENYAKLVERAGEGRGAISREIDRILSLHFGGDAQ